MSNARYNLWRSVEIRCMRTEEIIQIPTSVNLNCYSSSLWNKYTSQKWLWMFTFRLLIHNWCDFSGVISKNNYQYIDVEKLFSKMRIEVFISSETKHVEGYYELAIPLCDLICTPGHDGSHWLRWGLKDMTYVYFYHYNDVIISVMVSQITRLTIVFSTVYSSADQRKHRWPVNSPHKKPVMSKMLPFDDVII